MELYQNLRIVKRIVAVKKRIDERLLKKIEAESAAAPFLKPGKRGKEFREESARKAHILEGLERIFAKPHAAERKPVFVGKHFRRPRPGAVRSEKAFRITKRLGAEHRSVQVKENIVEQDPLEHGIRKALNLGHTVGHAFESLALAEGRPVLHGYAVAWGIVCELYLSYIKVGFPKDKMRQTIQFVKENYGGFAFNCKQYDQLYELMKHDKKNTSGVINFTLLKEVGDICLNQTADKDTIFEMFDFYRECM